MGAGCWQLTSCPDSAVTRSSFQVPCCQDFVPPVVVRLEWLVDIAGLIDLHTIDRGGPSLTSHLLLLASGSPGTSAVTMSSLRSSTPTQV